MSVDWCREQSRVIRATVYGPGLPFVADLGLQDLLAEEVLIVNERQPKCVACGSDHPEVCALLGHDYPIASEREREVSQPTTNTERSAKTK